MEEPHKVIEEPHKVEEIQKKQYLLMADELSAALLTKLVAGLSLVEVIGMPIAENANYQLLANPISKKSDLGGCDGVEKCPDVQKCPGNEKCPDDVENL